MLSATPFNPRAILRSIKVCFWVCFGAFICFGLLSIVVEKCALAFAPTSRVGYFLKYSTLVGSSGTWKVATYEQVIVNPRPHNCEWSTAPLGDKHCHYDPSVHSVRTSVTDKGDPLVSYDEGKTSHVNAFNETPGVYVSWERIEE
jgi:hypothetical protein